MSRRVRVVIDGRTVVDTDDAQRILETSHPPVFYVSPDDVRPGVLQPNRQRTFCEYKGIAHYWDADIDGVVHPAVAWSYREPSSGYERIAGWVAFYPSRVEACLVDEEKVVAQASEFYGGWITSEIVGTERSPR